MAGESLSEGLSLLYQILDSASSTHLLFFFPSFIHACIDRLVTNEGFPAIGSYH